MSLERKLRGLKIRKRSVITSFSTITSFVTNFNEERDAIEVPVRLENLNILWADFTKIQSDLELLEESEEEQDALLKERTEVEKAYYRAKGTLMFHNRNMTNTQTNEPRSHEPAQLPQVKLPDVKLPVFSGEFENWLNFHDLFVSLVHTSAHLSTIQKFYYLRSSLTGEALKLIQTIPICNDQYPVAWKMLVDHFSNPRRLLRTYIQSLFDFPCIKRESAHELHSMIERFESNVRVLKQLGEHTEHWDSLLIHILSTRLDSVTKRDWEEYSEANKSSKFQQLIEFLQSRVNVLQSVVSKPDHQQQGSSFSKKPNLQRAGNHGAIQKGFRGCLACSGSHSLYQCDQFSRMSADEKERLVRSKQLCRNCLRPGHMAKNCSSETSCRKCRGRHHTLICTNSSQRSSQDSQPGSGQQSSHSHLPNRDPGSNGSTSSASAVQPDKVSSNIQAGSRSKVLLATAIINLIDDNGGEYPVRALLDSGSECCFVTERVAQRMKIRRNKVNLSVAGIGQSSSQVLYQFQSTLRSRITDFSAKVNLLVLSKVTADLPTLSVDVSSWKLPPGIQLADPSFYDSGTIDVVVGAEVFFDLFKAPGRISLGDTLPTLVNSVLGWVVSGKVSEGAPRSSFICNVASIHDLHHDMERFWAIEDDSTPAYSPEEALCEKIFTETVTRDPSGRYIVRLPLKDDLLANLGDNKRTALHQFHLLEKRLNRDPALAAEYRKFMDEYIQLGHMKISEESSETDAVQSFYLPHHPVIREESSTTKVRVVYNASCKSQTGLSLNDVLLVGPTVQQDLRSIIIRSRFHPVMLIADVAKMYRQILHYLIDTQLLKIFWRPTSDEPIRVYKLKTVTYGTSSAPFLATRVLLQLAEDEKHNYPLAAEVACKDFYVDDLFTGAKTIEEAIELRKQMDAMFSSAGMQLRKWMSNYPAVLEDVPEENRAIKDLVNFDKDQSVKTLGLHWEPHSDRLKYSISNIEIEPESPITKRSTLSSIARLFDPLGLVGPVVLIAKVFMQALWSLKDKNGKPSDWDQELPEPMKLRWCSYVSLLPRLNDLRIDRFVVLPNTNTIELHYFSDASEAAYGTCVYVRSTNSAGEIKTALLTSRSKVAPLKQVSIPRLELCGALLAAELHTKIADALLIDAKTHFWVDSTTVLSWLQSRPTTWTTFVANRVAKIQNATQNCEWHFVPGSQNPADIISRGLPADELDSCKVWWEGPAWLQQSPEFWPASSTETSIDPECSIEARKTAHVAASTSTISFIDEFIAKFSNYQRLLRTTAYWKRLFVMLRLPRAERKMSTPLTTAELQSAEFTIVRLVQQNAFANEWQALQKQQAISTSSQLRWFSPFLGTGDVMRIGGRLGHSSQSYDSQHQILLPKSHPLSTLLVRCYHERHLHAAAQLLTNILRLRFWILGGRNLIRQVIRACVPCFRARPKLVEQFMGELPSSRVTASRPFSVVGIDFWGPVYLKPRYRRDSPPKAYVAVFICFVTKAVHLELVADLSTVKFMQSFRRFVSRRGLCSDVYTDNGKNFVGAANELRRLMRSDEFKQQMADECSNNGIRWHFNPPKGSHFGGLWEAAIRSAQKHFVRVLGEQKLPYDDMQTLLAQIECCLNSRPLIKLTDDPSDLQTLTPGHFLVGTSLKTVPDKNYEDVRPNWLEMWQQTQQLFQHFWKRWHMEYLQTLQPRTKWLKPPVQLQKDQLVLILDENQPPTRWPTARIHELHPGKDGVVRVVTLQTAKGLSTRPVAKLCILPIPVEESTSASNNTTSSTAPQ